MAIRLHDLVPSLQVAIGPVILVSGVGLLLLSMTNRLGRVIDRSRLLALELRSGGADHHHARSQLEILARRARLIRQAITLAIVSALAAAMLIITLFVAAVFELEAVGVLVAALFIGCMVALIGALVAFLRDINLSLEALKLDVGR